MESRFAFRLVDGPVDESWARSAVAGADAGCTVVFLGTIREHGREQPVVRLEYEAYPRMVEEELARIARAVMERHAVLRIAVAHARGTLQPGQCSLALAVASAHRAPAFAAAVEFVERLKECVPIWKKEVYPDGSHWVGRGS